MSAASLPAVGIDLGTVYSVVAYLDSDGKPCTIPNAEGDFTTPSVVLFDSTGVIVGKEAVKAARVEPERVAAFAKRDMGEAHCSRAIAGERLPPEVVQSLVLRKLRADAELMVGPFQKVVVTVPAYFNEPRRKATQDAGRLAGLDVIDIINEPTAAAIAFGVRHGYLSETGESRKSEKILVYDLGGGTFDVTVMSIDGKKYETLATAGDVYLGGIDWDNRIVDYLAERFVEQHGADPREDAAARQRLLQEAEDVKRALTARGEVFITFDFNGQAVRTKLTRAKFVELTADLLDRTRFTSQKVLRDAGIDGGDLTRVLLVGGSTRMPMVREMLEKESGLRCDRSVSADEAVAHGAAIYAGILLARDAGERPAVSVTNVNSHDLGVLGIEPGTGRPRRKVLIPRNSSLPATHSGRFVTHTENQKTVAVPVIEGGDASGNNATDIGKCVVKNLPGQLAKGTTVVVNFTYTDNGRLTVSATLPEIENAGATMTIERASGLSDQQVNQWQQRIAEGLQVGREAPEDGEVEGDEEQSLTVPEDTQAEDADATLWEEDEATVADDAVPDEFLAGLEKQQEADKPKPQKKKPPTREEPKRQSKPQQPKPAPEPSEEVHIDGAPPAEDDKIDPEDDAALGDFLSGLQ